MDRISGGRLVAEALRKEGVKYLFTLCGSSIDPIYDACLDTGIRVIDTRHESAAVHMADVWSRITGGVGVSAVTSGPGHTNSLTGIATAWNALSRVIAISGNSEAVHDEMGPMHEMDQIAFVRRITKWSKLITDPTMIPKYMAIAFRQVMSGIPGPVHLSFAQDALLKKVDISLLKEFEPRQYRTESPPAGDPETVDQAARLLRSARRPAVIVGGGALWSKAGAALKKFAETYQVPIFSMGLGRGVFPDDHPLSFGYGSARLNGAARAFREADVIMLIGQRLNFRLNYGRPPTFNPEARLIEVDLCAEEIGRNRQVEIGIVGDVRIVLEQLNEAFDPRHPVDRKDWMARVCSYQRDFFEEWRPCLESSKRPIHPLRLCNEVRKLVDGNSTVVLDGGDILQWARISMPAYGPARLIDTGPIAGIGMGIPFAIGAKLARPEEKVILVSGDGSLGFHIMEFSTAVRHKTPFVAVISNDGAWGMIKNDQIGLYGDQRVVGTELGLIRYDKIVEDLGGYGELVEDPQDIAPALQRAFDSGLPACINVITECLPSPITEAQLSERRKYAT
ncbi:MAG: thiamine pyrophosphate-binding protein [Syntrophaceae bacterium]|nr:thiamine pyrophosphate-binding protein [Syntrophaceae bacterium]